MPSENQADLKTLFTPRQRRTCALAWSGQMSRADIAAAQGISPQGVAMRLYRARKKLRQAGITPPLSKKRTFRTAAHSLSSCDNV